MSEETYTISLPLWIIYNKKQDKFYLNLNQYRNTHFHILNKAKELFEVLVKDRIEHLPKIKKLDITYYLFTGSDRSVDLANVCSVVDKFFCDTLVNNNKLIDDNINVISNINYRFGGIDKKNGRVEAVLHNIELEEEEPMKIIMTADEVESLVKSHVRSIFNIDNNISINLEFNNNNYEVIIGQKAEPTKTSTPAQKPVEARTEAPKATPVQEPIQLSSVAVGPVVPVSGTSEPKIEVAKDSGLTSLFNGIGSSAPPKQQESAPTAVSNPQSLFANLTKPINTPKTE